MSQSDFKNLIIRPDTGNRTSTFPANWNEYDFIPPVNKLYFILDGHVEVHVKDQVIKATAGDLLFLPKNQLQSRVIVSKEMTHYWLHFTCPMDKNDLDLVDTLTFPMKLTPIDKSYIKETFIKLLAAIKQDDMQGRIHTLMYSTILVDYYLTNCNDVQPTFLDDKFNQLNKIRLYIQDHLNRPITIEELSSQMHLHPNYFNNLFKSYFNVAPKQYINSLKVQRAKELLLVSNQSIEEIANNLGFQDKFYFSRLFKKKMGVSPQQFRKNMKRDITII